MERDEIMGNVNEGGLKGLMDGENVMKYWGLKKDDIETCCVCEYRYGCDDCRPVAKNMSGSLFGKTGYCSYHPEDGEWKSI